MLLTKAEEYLRDVLEHKRCIPYSRYDHSVGRCSAAIQFGLTRRRTYRAHGSINAYCSSNCHVDIICEEVKENVKKEKKEEKKVENIFINPVRHIRRALAKHLKTKKYVTVGGKK